jgi:hypothetical protein
MGNASNNEGGGLGLGECMKPGRGMHEIRRGGVGRGGWGLWGSMAKIWPMIDKIS